jgi:NADH:ubiquinone oxidoreductase subunit 3 (subunit A)
MIYGPLLFLSVVLFELFRLLKLADDAKAIIATSQQAMRVVRSPEIADREKESFMRRASIETLKATLRLAAKFLLVGAILFALFELIVAIFPGLGAPLRESLLSPAVIVILTAAVVGYAWARKLTLRNWRARRQFANGE